MVSWPAYVILVLAWIGAAHVAWWLGKPIGWLAWQIDKWSRNRTYLLCGHAIIRYEFERGMHIGEGLRYALGIMRKSEVVE